MIVWFTGLSGAGKSTLAAGLGLALKKKNSSIKIVDGDMFRKKRGTQGKLSKEEIISNNHQIIERCSELIDNYDYLIVAVISPYPETRNHARKKFGDKYFEVFVDCPPEELLRRDTKGLYRKAINGEIDNLIGFSEKSPYEKPGSPDVVLETSKMSIETSVSILLEKLKVKNFCR